MLQNQSNLTSPRWSATTKLLVGLVIVSIAGFLIYRFSSLVPPLLMIFIITYLLHPLTASVSRALRIPWKVAVNIIYLLIVVILIGLLTWGSVGLVGQVQSLVNSIQGIIRDLPRYITDLSTQVFVLGPFELDMSDFDLNDISRQLLSMTQPLLSQTGNLVGALAGGAATILGWTLFILTVSYFVMSESSGLRENILQIDIPGYTDDLRRLGDNLSRIWNAFLRGQIIVFLLALIIYSILLPALGVRYAIGIALMAGLAKFLPYIGPAITWLVMALVTFFQPVKPFDLQPLTYMLIVVVITFIIDNWVIDSLITPRIMARALKVHPGAILVAALIAANLLGILGVIIAAPFLATITLLGRYTMRKMFDQDPWAETEHPAPPPSIPDLLRNIVQYWKSRLIKPRRQPREGEEE